MPQNTAAAMAPQPVAGIKDGLAGILSVFIDPEATARRVTMRWFWIYPFIVMTAVTIFQQIAVAPYRMRAQELLLQERGLAGEQLQNQLAMMAKFAWIGWVVAPLFMLALFALTAWLINAAASIVDAGTRFSHLFSLVTVCSMFYALALVANVIVLRSKPVDDIQSMRDLMPALGLDIFLHDAPKAVMGLVAFFSVFQIWAIVMYGLTFAALTRTSKGKAFFATSPAWMVGLVISVLSYMAM